MSTISKFSDLLAMGFDIMTSAIQSTGAIVVQVGDAVNSIVDSDRAEWWQHTGFRSLPANPTQGQSSCQGLAFRRSDHDLVFATTDLRHSSIWQDLNPDEAQMYSFGGSCRVVCRANGKVQVVAQEIDLGSLSPSDSAGLASKIDQGVTTIVNAVNNAMTVFNAHIHILTLTSGTGTAAPPATPQSPISPAPSSVASATVKISS